MAATLFKNQTTNGNSVIIESNGGYSIAKLSGALDGGTVALEFDFNDNDFQPLISDNSPQTFTVPGVQTLVFLKNGVRIRAVLSSAGASTNVTLRVL